jgi:O-antigen/teichoic acid export membrane protein
MSSAGYSTSFFRKFTSLFIGLVFVQVINFLFSLILPKYFSPSEFAEFGIFTSLVFILIEVVNAKLDIAVMLGKHEVETLQIINAAFTFAVGFFLLLFLIVLLFISFIPEIYLLIPFIVILYGVQQPILVYLNKIEKYKVINIFRIIQVVATSVLTIYLAVNQINHALIIGFGSGLAIATLFSLLFIQPKINFNDFKYIWKKFDQFPKYGTWSSLFNNISRNSIPVLLAQFFSKQFVGYYAYSTRLLNAPTGMYTSALSQVYFKAASEQDNFTLKKTTQKIILFTFCLAIIPTIIFLFFGKDIFFYLFNGEWLEAGKVTQYLILWYFLGVIASPVSALLDIKNKLKFEFGFNGFLFIVRVAAIVTGGLLHDFYLAILLFSVAGVLMNLFLLYYINFVILKE